MFSPCLHGFLWALSFLPRPKDVHMRVYTVPVDMGGDVP